MKSIKYFKVISLTVILFLFNINIYSQNSTFEIQIAGIDNSKVTRPVYSVSTMNDGKTVSGKYLTILGKNHSTVIKPYIIVEGIDFLNSTYFDKHIWLFNGYNNINYKSNALIYNLYDKGYDVIILDFNNSTIKIQDNAMLLVQLLKDVYTNNYLTEDNFVVMGFSMGGLVARYALT